MTDASGEADERQECLSSGWICGVEISTAGNRIISMDETT